MAALAKKLTITVDPEVYQGLYRVIGKGNISRFLNSIARPYVLKQDLAEAYRQMSLDKEREAEALEWSENLIGDTL